MTALEKSSNITHILKTFDHFVNLFESKSWLKNASIEQIKNVFKLGAFVEKTVDNFRTKHILEKFIQALNSWWVTKNRSKFYESDFYASACDQLLMKFFKTKLVKSSSVDIAVRVYTAMFPQQRFEKMLSQLLLKSFSYKALLDFIILSKDSVNLKELECRLMLNSWSEDIDKGGIDKVKSDINQLLANYKINSTLADLMFILLFKDVSPSEERVQSAVLDQLISKMLDQSILSKPFWLAFFNLDENVVLEAAVTHVKVFEQILNFLLYLGCMMNCQGVEGDVRWVPDENSFCVEITFCEMCRIVKLIHCNERLRPRLMLKLRDAKMTTGTKVWEEILLGLS